MGQKQEMAVELFRQKYNCAQAVLLAFCEDYGMPKEMAMRVACGLGGGFRTGEICGAVAGAVLVVGLKTGNATNDDNAAKHTCGEETRAFINEFRRRHGAVACRDILKRDPTAEGWMGSSEQKEQRRTTCTDKVASAAGILEEMGY